MSYGDEAEEKKGGMILYVHSRCIVIQTVALISATPALSVPSAASEQLPYGFGPWPER